MNFKPASLRYAPLICAGFMLSACSVSNPFVKKDELTQEQIQQEQRNRQYQEELARNATQTTKVGAVTSSNKSGTYIRAVVNGQPITNFDVTRRVAFMKLRRVPNANAQAATEEMVEQAIKLQAARDEGTLAGKPEVDAAFANFAQGNKTTPEIIGRELNRMGVGADHFKDFIKTQISWNRAVSKKVQSDNGQLSQREAIVELRKSGQAKPQATEYTLQQVIFVIPPAKRKALVAARRTEANAMRQRFSGCPNTVNLAKQLRDVSVFERGRMLEPELPGEWKDEIAKTPVGGTTRVQESEKGVEFIAVCAKRQVDDDRAAQIVQQSQKFEDLNSKGSELSQNYLKELKDKAKIIYR